MRGIGSLTGEEADPMFSGTFKRLLYKTGIMSGVSAIQSRYLIHNSLER